MLKQLSISFLLIILFTVAIIGFAVNFASDNDAEVDISDDEIITELNTDLRTDLSNLREDSESTYKSIIESSVEEGETTPSGGQFALNPQDYLSATENIVKVGYVKIFGTGSGFGIFLTAFVGLLGTLLIFAIWKAWIGRSVD